MAEQSAEDRRARYLAALDLAKHDYEMAWLVFGSIFVGQTVLLGFVGLALTASPKPSRWVFIASAVIGILLWFPWFASFKRNAANHAYRVHKASSMEPEGWDILLGSGRRYAEGKEVIVTYPDGTQKCFQTPPLGRWHTRASTKFLQFVVLAAYLAMVGAVLEGWVGQ